MDTVFLQYAQNRRDRKKDGGSHNAARRARNGSHELAASLQLGTAQRWKTSSILLSLVWAPWEARAFGIAVALNESGVYPWRDFSHALAMEIAAAERDGIPSSYYERWLAAMEKLAMAKGLITPVELEKRTAEYASGVYDDHHDHRHHRHDEARGV